MHDTAAPTLPFAHCSGLALGFASVNVSEALRPEVKPRVVTTSVWLVAKTGLTYQLVVKLPSASSTISHGLSGVPSGVPSASLISRWIVSFGQKPLPLMMAVWPGA